MNGFDCILDLDCLCDRLKQLNDGTYTTPMLKRLQLKKYQYLTALYRKKGEILEMNFVEYWYIIGVKLYVFTKYQEICHCAISTSIPLL